jgi:hypothetical protein
MGILGININFVVSYIINHGNKEGIRFSANVCSTSINAYQHYRVSGTTTKGENIQVKWHINLYVWRLSDNSGISAYPINYDRKKWTTFLVDSKYQMCMLHWEHTSIFIRNLKLLHHSKVVTIWTPKKLNLHQLKVTGAITLTKARVFPSDLWPNPCNIIRPYIHRSEPKC